jgi:hypothetical protein
VGVHYTASRIAALEARAGCPPSCNPNQERIWSHIQVREANVIRLKLVHAHRAPRCSRGATPLTKMTALENRVDTLKVKDMALKMMGSMVPNGSMGSGNVLVYV